ncbi:phosphatase PAP2 family protein [Vibrio sp. 10N]|uniref:phosphatase PAP2 family protein n=1 Tax=Vibrio sp. 10N TaxID=3058938 RepID=UPI0030C74271
MPTMPSLRLNQLRFFTQSKLFGIGCLAIVATILYIISLLLYPFELTTPVSNELGVTMQVLSYSAGHQGFLFTLAILGVTTLWVTRSTPHRLILIAQLALLLILSFGAKTVLKQWTESPRPYTYELAEEGLISSPQQFYTLDSKVQNQIIILASDEVSDWRTKHWLGETDYSFPSGHTIFVAVCVLFFAGLFASHQHNLLACLVMLWAVAVASSRLWLGMHRPEDLFASLAFALVLFLIVPSASHRFPLLSK